MEAVVGALAAAVIAQAVAVWYKIGKIEQKLSDLCREIRNGNHNA